ncbi:MAG TPA: hypothetical protein VKS60_17455 [Stellaceae bacterium]|nr:hypothetical protein [Stellaceae bacterium]
MRLLGDLEHGECAAADLGLDEIAHLLCSAKKQLLQQFAAIEREREQAARRTNVVSFRSARARLRRQAATRREAGEGRPATAP